jgi:hypothetical protein
MFSGYDTLFGATFTGRGLRCEGHAGRKWVGEVYVSSSRLSTARLAGTPSLVVTAEPLGHSFHLIHVVHSTAVCTHRLLEKQERRSYGPHKDL